jgi:hypothetical protein
MEKYFKAGVRLVRVGYPRESHIHAYASPTKVRVLALLDEREVGGVLRGFHMALQDVIRIARRTGLTHCLSVVADRPRRDFCVEESRAGLSVARRSVARRQARA